MTTDIAIETASQIGELQLDRTKPLIICDVDEVVVHFIAGLERYLHRNELWLDPASFGLYGNVKRRDTGQAIEQDAFRDHLASFFDEEVHRLDAIQGAASALSVLAGDASVLMLTNLPDKYRQARSKNLESHGIPYPVITNQGPKGPAVRSLTTGFTAPVIFIDDIPSYLGSVNECCPDVHLVHFMQDDRFGRHVPPLDFVSLRADNWIDTHSHIRSLMVA